MTTLTIKGTIFSGKSQGAKFIRLPWVRRQIKRKLGFNPYPGTLNVKLEDAASFQTAIQKAEPIKIAPAPGFYLGKCFKAIAAKRPTCAIVIPQIPDYPEDTVELIAPANLRKALGLKDGDTIEIEMTL